MEKCKGLVHIICGDGKGKTTAAIGLSIRAAGRKKKVLIAQFLKNDDSGELVILNQIEEITIMPIEKFFGFTWQMSDEQKREAKDYYNAMFQTVIQKVTEEEYDLLVLDEIHAAYEYGFVDHISLINFLTSKPDHLEVVMTGRNPAQELCEKADYISEVKKIKHPYEKGVPARKGIEF